MSVFLVVISNIKKKDYALTYSIFDFVRIINKKKRIKMFSIYGSNNSGGFINACVTKTGYPNAINFTEIGPVYEPDLILPDKQKELKNLQVFISSFEPNPNIVFFKKNIFIGHPDFVHKRKVDVFIPTKTPGYDTKGLIVRSDNGSIYKLEKIVDSFESKLDKKSREQNKNRLNEGCFVYELEADSTIPSEYVLLMHFLGEINIDLEKKIKNYLLSKQNKDGGWPLYFDGESNVSASVKAYYALKLSGVSPNERLMKLAKKFIIDNGGAEQSNVFTRITLAQFGQISWEAIPFMPIQIINFPKWFPFNIYKISYWSRTVLIPLLLIMNKKPLANNPNGIDIHELFITPGKQINNIKPADNKKFSVIFKYLDKILRLFLPRVFSKKFEKKCIEDTYIWILERLNGEDGLGGIFPAMVNALIALKIDEKQRFKKHIAVCKKSINNLVVENKNFAYCQPCVSPVWDTGWMGHVLLEKGNEDVEDLVQWFLKKEIKIKGDWSFEKKNVEPGGWAFQFNNDHYPDVDDTALVGMFLDRYNRKEKNKKFLDALREPENGLFQCSQRMADGELLILIIINIILIQFPSLIMVLF